MPNHRYEQLGGGISVCVSDAHTFGTDAILLGHFAASFGKARRSCDLGCGCGIIPLLLYHLGVGTDLTGVDIQPEAVEQFRLSVKQSGAEEHITPLTVDLRKLKGALDGSSFDLVTCNPPYKPDGTGVQSDNQARMTARFEGSCTLGDVCASAARLLRPGGKFVLCHRPERLCDVLEEMRKHKLEPKALRFAAAKQGDRPWLVLVMAQKGGKPFLQVLPQFVTMENGDYSREYREIYGEVYPQ